MRDAWKRRREDHGKARVKSTDGVEQLKICHFRHGDVADHDVDPSFGHAPNGIMGRSAGFDVEFVFEAASVGAKYERIVSQPRGRGADGVRWSRMFTMSVS